MADILKIDFSSLSKENRKEGRFPYRGPIMVQLPGVIKTQSGAAQDVSRSGIGITVDSGQFQLGQEVEVEFYGANSPAIRGKFKIVHVEPDVRHGKPIVRLGLTISQMPKLAEKNFFDLLDELEKKQGFEFDDNR